MKINIVLFTATAGLGSTSTLIIIAALALNAMTAAGQEVGTGPRFDGPGGPRGPGSPGGPRPMPPIISALDANKDGKIDANEIANASKALKALDTNNDGELTADEINGPRLGAGRGGPPGSPGRPSPPNQQPR